MNNLWFPSIDFINIIYSKHIPKVRNPIFNLQGIKGTLDKVKYGIPSQPPPIIWDRVSMLYREIIENHYFTDGNKRIGSLLAGIFLFMNRYEFFPPQGEIFSITMKVAQGLLEYGEIRDWFMKNSIRKGTSLY